MTFKGNNYRQNQCPDLFSFIDRSSKGEYMNYFDKVVFNTGMNFVCAYRDDLENYWEI